MNKNKAIGWLYAPLSNKISVLKRVYWRIKTQFFYRPMFRSIGRKVVIYRPMLITNADCIAIGDQVSIRDGVRLEAIRDVYGRTPCLMIGSNTLIEQGVQVVCHNRVIIGRDVSIAGRCAIVDVTHPYREVSDGNIGAYIANEDSFVEIGDGAFLGYGAVILPNVRIGKRAIIGANSVVTNDVPDFAVVAGIPAKLLKIY